MLYYKPNPWGGVKGNFGYNEFRYNTIVDLSRVGSSETKSLIMGILIMKLNEYRSAVSVAENSKLRHITIIEETHNILKKTPMEQSQEGSNLQGKSVEMKDIFNEEYNRNTRSSSTYTHEPGKTYSGKIASSFKDNNGSCQCQLKV